MKVFRLFAPIKHPTRSIVCVAVVAETEEGARSMASNVRPANQYVDTKSWRVSSETPIGPNPFVVESYLA